MTHDDEILDIPGWHVLMEAQPLGDTVMDHSIQASAEEMAMVKKRLELRDIEGLSADFKFEKQNGYIVHVTGVVKAKVVQECVVTLEPIETEMHEQIEAWFADPKEVVGFDKVRKQKELETEEGEIPILDEKDDPEPLIDGAIDLGDLAVQFLSLGLDPYPHKEGAVHDLTDEDHERIAKERMQDNPFAKLKEWKDKHK